MRRLQARTAATFAAIATIGLAVSPWRALAATHPAHASVHSRALASPTTRASGSDDGGGSDDGSVTTRTSPMKPVGGVGPLLGGSGAPAAAAARGRTHGRPAGHTRHPQTATNGGGEWPWRQLTRPPCGP